MQNIETTDPKVIWKSNCILGEGTLWVKEHNSIYFVDIKKDYLNIKKKKENKILQRILKEYFFITRRIENYKETKNY